MSTKQESVLVIGGGLAGLAAAQALAPHGYRVRLLDARPRLGGRAGSFTDPQSGQLVDACQHVGMGCCTNLTHFLKVAGVDHLLAPQPVLYFMTPDGRVSRFRADALPAPLHLARAFLGLHTLTYVEKLKLAWALARLWATTSRDDPPFLPWLHAHGQSQRVIDRFWGLVLVSALNETVDRIGLRYARKVFVDGFLTHPKAFEVQVPTVPLGRLYGEELQAWFEKHQVEVLLDARARSLMVENDRVTGVVLRDGTVLTADWYVSAVPWDALAGLLSAELTAAHPAFSGLSHLEASPITSVHAWYDRPVLGALPHAVLVDCLGQWVFDRGPGAEGEHYVQVVVSAARPLRGLGRDEIARQITEELASLFPAAKSARLQRSKVVTEHAATFSAVPGVDRWRPPQDAPLANLALAGDWTDTGWPATMEGAVRSGYRAAEVLLARSGRPLTLVQPDLGRPRGNRR